jgi:hypothetical protein
MIHTQTEIDNLVELAIIQRAELKKLVESLPQLREHLSSEIERSLEEIEPAIRIELEQFVTARTLDAHAKTSTALTAKIDELARSLEDTTAARYSVLMSERAKNDDLLAQAEQRIAEAASALPDAVKGIVTGELARFPRAGEIDQLRKEFAEPKGLNPRGKWSPGQTYQRLDLVTINGDSFVSNTDGNRERPSRSAADWTLNAARGNSGGGGGITSLTDLLPVPSSGQILGSEGTSYVPKTLVAGSNITITESPTEITITGDEGQIELQDGTAAAPSLFFVNDPDTGLYRPATNSLGVTLGGVEQALFTGTTVTLTPNLVVSGTGTINGTSIPASKTLVTTTDKLSALAATTSAELAGVISDETGTGSLVFASSPTLTTPNLGTPSTLVGTNITGTAAGLTAGNVTTIPNLTGDVTSVGNATSIAAGVIVDADINASAAIADTKLATISTAGKVSNSATTATDTNTASAIVARDASGNFTAGTITADLTGNVSGSSGSTTGNAATATALQTARAINGVNFDGTAAITVAADAGTLTGATLASNVLASSLTSVGTLSGLTVSAPISGSVTGSSGSTTGNAATATALATGRTIAITGDLAYTSASFDGTGNVTAAGTLATVATPGSTGSSTEIPIITINAKGLTTSISTAAVVAPAGTLSGSTLASGVTASSLTSLGTIANLTATAGTIATTPTASTDIANKLYVDTVAQGLDAKASCLAATTANITLSGTQTIDGVSVVAGNRVLVKDQTAPEDNGIYLCASGAWTRTTDAATFDSLVSAFTFIEQGSTNADAGFVCTADAGGTIGTTAIPFSQFSGAGTFTAGTGLTLTGTVFSLTSPVAVANGGTGLTSLGTGVATFLGTPSSANLAAAVSDETGSGALVFATSPTLTTPALGTPSALVGTNITGTAAGLTAGNVTTNANLTGAITSVGNTTSLGSFSSANLAAALTDETGSGALVFASSPTLVTPNLGAASATSLAASGTVTGSNLSGTNTGDQTTITGNAGTATTLQTARNINGVSFNGSADITVTAAAGTLTGATLASGVTASSLTSLGTIASLTATTADINGGTIDGTAIGGGTAAAGAFTTLGSSSTTTLNGTTIPASSTLLVSGGALGTPSSGTLTSCTGLPISTGVSGLGTDVATALAVNVGSSGAVVTNGGALGTPSSGTVTNLTGTASININGTVGATTPSTGAFTTLSSTGATSLATETTGLGIFNSAPNLYLPGIAGVAIGPVANASLSLADTASTKYWNTYNNNSTLKWYLSAAAYSTTGATGDVMALSSTGLSVTGTLSSTASMKAGTTGTNGHLQLARSSDGATITNFITDGTNGIINSVIDTIFQGNTTERMRITGGGNVGIGTADQFGGGVKVVGLTNATTAPASNPTGGGVLYVESGALKYRGSSGTVTTIANA